MIAACAASLAAGCSATSDLAGAGYAILTPKPASARAITREDTRFARQVAAHNRTCRRDRRCRK